MADPITKAQIRAPVSFLCCPLTFDLDNIDDDIAILGDFGLPNKVGDSTG
ncbi:MAG: hypothetical protein P8L68_03865 [Paracoccaceae bacterium]|nr:hypothetical protein [Paracoccaceae bacterium]MDG1738609.1 hypothetical protein [Paracoccaceae bacterium]MDG2257613.1 hypothetical protein [Paracoccaceae bacterium]